MPARRHRGRRGKAPSRKFKPADVGLALIARDAASTLPALLESIRDAFCQVVLVDTGSSDGTAGLFREWCRAARQRHSFAWFPWCDDFAAARRHAYALLDTPWTCWADADDTIENARLLPILAASAPRELAAFAFDYDYLPGVAEGRMVRERLVRAGAGEWAGRVHESQVIDGDVAYSELVRWTHHGTPDLEGRA